MANTENINVVSEEAINAAVQAVEAIPVKPNNKFGIIAGVVFVGGLLATGVALLVNNKNKKKAKEAAATGVDNIQVAKDDFEEYDSTEE